MGTRTNLWPNGQPKSVGVMGGSFNPIHLGHALLAITVRETKPVDEVVLVPVFKHPIKKDLLPFEDRVAMCQLAVQASGIGVSTIERETEDSNAVMLRALRKRYPKGSKLYWVCGDDVFDWIDNERGRAMMSELDGVIVQRRLHRHKDSEEDLFYKSPVDRTKIGALAVEHGVKIDFIYGELPHYSSTLVRNSPASWRAFLPQKVAEYLDARPNLLADLVRSGDAPQPPPLTPTGEITADVEMQLRVAKLDLPPLADAALAEVSATQITMSSRRSLLSSVASGSPKSRMPSQRRLREAATSCVLRCLAVVHSLQRERGLTALALALKESEDDGEIIQKMLKARESTDELLVETEAEEPLHKVGIEAGTAGAIADELNRTGAWLTYDRAMLDHHLLKKETNKDGPLRWLHRASLLDKFSVRVDVLIDACERAFQEFIEAEVRPMEDQRDSRDNEDTIGDWLLLLFRNYAHCKESLGRLRSFICAGGQGAKEMIRKSFRARRHLNEVIEHKERMLQRVLSAESSGPTSAENPGAFTAAALHSMMFSVTRLEWELMGCFSASTPLQAIHQALAQTPSSQQDFDVHDWWVTLSKAIDLMLKLDQVLAAHICAYSP